MSATTEFCAAIYEADAQGLLSESFSRLPGNKAKTASDRVLTVATERASTFAKVS